jgi:hypothetical protein
MFDAVWDWFVVQRKSKSIREGSQCAYRGDGGNKCAAGVLIPDELYDPMMEGQCFGTMSDVVHKAMGLSYEDVQFVSGLQAAHDCIDRNGNMHGDFTTVIRAHLEQLAKAEGLTVP